MDLALVSACEVSEILLVGRGVRGSNIVGHGVLDFIVVNGDTCGSCVGISVSMDSLVAGGKVLGDNVAGIRADSVGCGVMNLGAFVGAGVGFAAQS